MKKIKLLISAIVVLIGVNTFSSVAHASVSLPDGTVINRNTMWTEVPTSYDGVEYYDVLVPYSKRISDIGGQSIGGRLGGYYETANAMDEGLASNYVGDYTSMENPILSRNISVGGATLSVRQENGLNVATDSSGNDYYLIALGHYFYHGPEGFLPFSSSNRGQLVDVVLTDGTVIHCIIKDCKDDRHTNGGEGSDHIADESSNFRWWYRFAPLEYEEGQNMFQAKNSEILEIFCNRSGLNSFNQMYGLGGGDCENHIAFIRMYKQKVGDAGHLRNGDIGNSASYSLGETTFRTGDGTSHAYGSSSLALTGSSLTSEWDISGMPIKSNLTAEQAQIILLGRDSLALGEADTVSILGNNIALLKEAELLDGVRTAIVFIGLVLLFYGFSLLVAMIFDRANTFIDFSLVKILTFGKMEYDPFEEKGGIVPKGYVSTKKLAIVSTVVIIVGVLLVTSGMTKLIGRLIYTITKYLG